jgi:hypothetical protein
MTRFAASALTLLCLLLASGVSAQGEPEAGPVPAGEGEIRVRVVRGGGSGAEGLDVVLYALSPDAAPGLAREVTDADGRVVFAGVAADPAIAYLVGVRAEGVPYGERVAFEADSTVVETEVAVAGTDTDTRLARLSAGTVRFDRGCDTLVVTEAHPIANPTDRVLYVPEDQREGREPVLVRELPLQAGPLQSPLGMLPQGLERDGRELRFWGPVYPGSQELEFGYGLPSGGSDVTFSWRFPRGAPGMSWLAPESGATLSAAALTSAAPRTLAGAAYTVMSSERLAPGASVEVQVSLEASASSALALRETRIWIELDDALLEATERHEIEVTGDEALEPGPAPLLCMRLPPGASDLRFDAAGQAMGPTADPSGALAIRGPIPAGTSSLSLSYQLPLAGGPAVFTRRFPLDLPLLEMFVSDTGVRPKTERLHRLRPIRSAERNYLHLQGFGFAADEELRIAFERLPVRRELPRMAALGFGLLAAGGCFAFLMGPLRSTRPEEARAPSRSDELNAELERVYGVIRDLDEDFETGKLSADDHTAMRSEQRARAVTLLGQQRAAQQEPAQAAASEPEPGAGQGREARFCIACGEALPARARFCPQCGEKTVAPGATDA